MKNVLIGSAIFLALGACGKKPDGDAKARANVDDFTKGMIAYLEKRGDLCLGKNAWPIDVTDREVLARGRNAVQMPVLERLGLVRSSDANIEVKTEEGATTLKVKRYQLTDEGRRYYVQRDVPSAASANQGPRGDFCAARLSLDKVVGWELSGGENRQAVVSYTYRVDAAPWTRDPEIQKVFPAVSRVVKGAGSDQLKEAFTFTPEGWIASAP